MQQNSDMAIPHHSLSVHVHTRPITETCLWKMIPSHEEIDILIGKYYPS